MFLNDPYGIHVHQNYVFVCDTKDHRVRVLDLELNHCFDISGIQEPMDITYFKGLYFVTSRKINYGEIVILDINFANKRSTCASITKADKTNFGRRIRGICANDKYLYVTERGHQDKPQQGGRILCLEYEDLHTLKCVSVFTTKDSHLPIDIACDDDNEIYYSVADKENKKYFVAKLVHHPRGTLKDNEVIYP